MVEVWVNSPSLVVDVRLHQSILPEIISVLGEQRLT